MFVATVVDFFRAELRLAMLLIPLVLLVGISEKLSANFDSMDTVAVQYTFLDGSISSEGFLVNGRPDGYWRNYHPGGALASEGSRSGGKLAGVWTFYDEKERFVESVPFEQDLKWGEAQTFDTTGMVIGTSTWLRDTLDGPMRRWGRNNTLLEEWPYIAGHRSGTAWVWDENDGRVIQRSTWLDGVLREVEQVNRYDIDGKKFGKWLVFWRHASVREDGSYENGLREGVFKFFSRSGRLERIETYHRGQLIPSEADAVILDIKKHYNQDGQLIRKGPYRGEVAVGLHQFYQTNGEVDRGEMFTDGLISSSGPLVGLGLKQGHWKEFWPDGKLRAEGPWDNGQKHGYWKYYNQNEVLIQQGKFNNGSWHGHWQWFYNPDQLHRSEHYYKGLEEGDFIELSLQGDTLARGRYEAGLKSGPWLEHVHDHKCMGAYLDGEFQGEWSHFFEDGRLQFHGEFIGGLPEGRHTWFFPSGRKSTEGRYEGGLKSGNWRYFDDLGMLKLVRQYERGRVVKLNGARINGRKKVESSE